MSVIIEPGSYDLPQLHGSLRNTQTSKPCKSSVANNYTNPKTHDNTQVRKLTNMRKAFLWQVLAFLSSVELCWILRHTSLRFSRTLDTHRSSVRTFCTGLRSTWPRRTTCSQFRKDPGGQHLHGSVGACCCAFLQKYGNTRFLCLPVYVFAFLHRSLGDNFTRICTSEKYIQDCSSAYLLIS